MSNKIVGADTTTGELPAVVEDRISDTIDAAVAAEATLARNADNLTSGTVADARIPAGIARDTEVTALTDALDGRLDTAEGTISALPATYASAVSNGLDVALYGAVGDGSTDDTAAIQAAINAAATGTLPAAKVLLRPGKSYKVTQLRLKTGVILDGQTITTLVYQKANTDNTDLIVLDDDTVRGCGVQNLKLSGNKTNQTTANKGIYFTHTTSAGQKLHTLRNVYVVSCKGDGIHLGDYTRATHLYDAQIYSNDGYGLVLGGADSEVTNIDVGQSGLTGVYIPGTSYLLSNVKSWYSGQVGGGADGHGFWLSGNRNLLTNCYAQENMGHGYQVFKSGNNVIGTNLMGCTSDADNAALTTFGGLNLFNAQATIARIVVTNTSGLIGRTSPAAALSGSSCTGNDVLVTTENISSAAVIGGTTADLARNTVKVAGRDQRFLDLTWAASQVIATPWTARTQKVTLTGDTTFTSASAPVGLPLRLILTQDATGGRGIVFSTGFVADWTPNTTPNAVNVIDFVGDGTNWLQVGADKSTSETPMPPTARYFIPVSPANSSTSNGLTNNTLRLSPFVVHQATSVVRIGAEITTIGETGSKLRLGIYADDGTGLPGALVVDAGQIAGDSATVQELTISKTLQPGLYWIGGVVQSAPTTQPTVRCCASETPPVQLRSSTIPAAGTGWHGYFQTSVSGGLPDPFVNGGISTVNPRLFLKTA